MFQKKAFGHIATLMPDGQPQTMPVWIDFDGRHVLVNTASGRQKTENLKHDSRVALSVTDPDDPYRYLEVRGRVIEMTTTGADAHINPLSRCYLDKDYPFRQPGKQRVLLKIQPEHVADISDVVTESELAAIAESYKRLAGFSVAELNARGSLAVPTP